MGCLPGTHLPITPAERMDLSALLPPLASPPRLNVGFADVLTSCYGGAIKVLGSEASVMSEVLTGS